MTRFEAIDKQGLSVVTVHSHPNGSDSYSETDDKNDKELFESVCNWFEDDRINGSAIMLPDGRMICRSVNSNRKFSAFNSVAVVGDSILIWKQKASAYQPVPEHGVRIAQTFGAGTLNLLHNLKVGVLGCSGTGSIIAELLARNCVGNLVLADPDKVEIKNLNRILNTSLSDAQNKTPKAEVLKNSIVRMGLGTEVEIYTSDTTDHNVIDALASCDVIFGCVDSARGRYHLECLASAYYIPYFDVGVYLEADGSGEISHADAAAHYMHPDNRSLMMRKGYTSKQLYTENLRADDPSSYKQQLEDGYLAGVNEDQPAVISVNMLAACLAFNDFLARLHKYRLDNNADFSIQRFQLVQGCYHNSKPADATPSLFSKYQGTGDQSFLVQKLKKGK